MAIGPYSIPDVLGVPAAVNLIPGFGAGLSLLTGDADGLISPNDSVWGIFQDGAPVVVAESVVAVDYRREFAISDYPVEQGAFESYDKVQLPRDVHMRFTAGTVAARSELLTSIDAILPTTQLVDVVTPDAVYTSLTLSHQDYSRTAQRGLGLLQVEVWALEVVQNGQGASTTGSTTADPSGAAQTNDGTVTPTPTNSTQATILSPQFYGPAGLPASVPAADVTLVPAPLGQGGIGSQ